MIQQRRHVFEGPAISALIHYAMAFASIRSDLSHHLNDQFFCQFLAILLNAVFSEFHNKSQTTWDLIRADFQTFHISGYRRIRVLHSSGSYITSVAIERQTCYQKYEQKSDTSEAKAMKCNRM